MGVGPLKKELTVVAKQNIPQHTFIGYYSGELGEGLPSFYSYELLNSGKKGYVDAHERTSCIHRYINAPYTSGMVPNVVAIERKEWTDVQQAIRLFTVRDINAGEELLLNYGEEYWKGHVKKRQLLLTVALSKLETEDERVTRKLEREGKLDAGLFGQAEGKKPS